MAKKTEQPNTSLSKSARAPVVVIMGHIDHGKSTLLDYIRKTNVTESEKGGITQTLSAYWKTIEGSALTSIVAINKIDKPEANVEKTKQELAENEIYLENYGGKIPFTEISAKVGTGVDNLLSLILILAEMEAYTGDEKKEASGFVIESNLDSKRGIQATLIIKDGTIKKGMTVVVVDCLCAVRMMENFKGGMIDQASFSSPIRIFGFDKLPPVGGEFRAFQDKKEAQAYRDNWKKSPPHTAKGMEGAPSGKKIIPIVLKADVSGSLEAIEKEISKIKSDSAEFRITGKGVGPISESDIKNISGTTEALIIGFNVKADKSAIEMADNRGIPISFFDIIYKMTEWLEAEMEARRPRIETIETTGKAKILRAFSRTKERQILGGKVLEGTVTLGSTVKIMRREFEIGRGKIVNLEKSKAKTSAVEEGFEFGMMIESKIEVVPGDIIELFSIAQK